MRYYCIVSIEDRAELAYSQGITMNRQPAGRTQRTLPITARTKIC